MVVGTKSGVQFMSLDPKEYPLPNCLSKAKKTINIGDAKRSRPALFSYRGDLFFFTLLCIQPLSDYNLIQQNDYNVTYIPEKDILFLGGTCMEDNINYHGGDVKQQPAEWQHTVEGCKKYCRTKAPFFSWVSPQHADTSIRSRCYCKTSDQGRAPLTGMTSGRVDCGQNGKKYCLC